MTRARKQAGTTGRKPPWKKANPDKKVGRASRKLTGRQKAAAKKRAARAGRHYPNLVDNMALAARKRSKKRGKT